ncbi:MAG: transglutaminase domain-containing protein, partial [Oscillospiraceae bacterium]|nr:transglutaminase domain-containing protein [Oscillospiraceae bacterium]
VYDSINPFDADDEARFAYYILKNLKGNCIAFQRASEIMLQRAGIETRRIQNDYTRGYGADKNVYIRHSWNLIKIEGKWYHFDATRFKYCPMGYSQVHMFTEDYAKKLNAGRRNVYTDYNYPNQEIPDIANG